MSLTALGCPQCEHFIGLVLLAEALRHNFHLVGGVWSQHAQCVAVLVAVCVHGGPLLSPYKPGTGKKNSTAE